MSEFYVKMESNWLDGSENTSSNDDNNYSENDDVNTESETKSVHSQNTYSNGENSDDVASDQLDDVIVANEKHLFDYTVAQESIRKPMPLRKTCCKSDSMNTFVEMC